MPRPRLARNAPAADTAAVLAETDRRDRLARATPALLAFLAAAGLVVLAMAGG
jgi:hypothetical protein